MHLRKVKDPKSGLALIRPAARPSRSVELPHGVWDNSSASIAGLKDIATWAQELLRVQPNISLYWLADNMPIKLEVDRAHYLEGSIGPA